VFNEEFTKPRSLGSGRMRSAGIVHKVGLMIWNPTKHSDEENLKWCWLRAVEWGRWPIFLSQVIAPPLLIFLSWKYVVLGFVAGNIAWALLVRYRFVNVALAYIGCVVVLFRWVTWPVATAYMFFVGISPECWVSLAWPLLIYLLGAFTPVQIGRIQGRFMRSLGYEPTEVNPLS
jgi:hypothetical protein